MLYTVGDTKSYLKALLNTTEPVMKVGRDTNFENFCDYKGGIVFKSIKEAEKYLEKIDKRDLWSVFGLKCNIDNMYYLKLDKTYRIIKDTEIVMI